VSERADNEDLEPDDGLFLTDAQLIRRLGVPRKIGYAAIRDLEKEVRGRPKFPGYDPLFPRRRFWPAVEKYFMLRHTHHWQEATNATAETRETGGNRDARPGMEAPQDALARLLDSATKHSRPRLSHKKPTLVATNEQSDRDA
jgi:hypothetical protein